MRPNAAGGSLATLATDVPLLQGLGHLPEPLHRLIRIEEVSVVAIRAAEMLSPELQAKVSSVLPSAIA